MERSPVVGVLLSPEISLPSDSGRRLALGVLRRLPGLLQPVLLALLDPGVTGQEASPLQRGAVLRIHQRERACDPQPQRAGLPGDPAPGDPCDHVELIFRAEGHQRLADQLLVHLVREELLQRPVIDQPLPRARRDADPRDGFLAAAGAHRLAGHHRPGRRPAAPFRCRLGGVLRYVRFGVFLRLHALFGFLRACGLGHGTFLALSHRLSSQAWLSLCPGRYLALADGVPAGCATWVMVKGVGCCAWCGWSGPAYTFSLRSMFRPSVFLGSMPLTAFSTSRSGRLASSSP